MKSLITTVLVLLAYANNAQAETTLIKGINGNFTTAIAVGAQQFENELSERGLGKGKFSPVEDHTVLNPETVVANTYERPIEEVIAENNKIIEVSILDEGYLFFVETTAEEIITADNEIIDSSIDTEVYHLYLEKTIEEVIAEDNAIIERTVPSEVGNLDLTAINKNSILAEN